MCCFTGPVERVSATNIYARAAGARQTLVYSMAYAAASPLAMVLPIPVPAASAEDAVRFISLEECADFFRELAQAFPEPDADIAGATLGAVEVGERTLEVQQVGAYEASFVPTPADFGRLDERFRLPAELWFEIGRYRDWGFAVFKLRQTAFAHVHPMAFDFPRRNRNSLFFPTFHIHHGRYEASARFDHTLYCQPEPALNWHLGGWEFSQGAVGAYVRCAQGRQLIDLARPCWRREIGGYRENRDTWVGKGEAVPSPVSA